MIILLDVDGVLCDFVGGVIKSHNLGIDSSEWSSWDYHKRLGISDEDLWSVTNDGKWWTELEPYPWAFDLLGMVKQYADVIFCTSPSLDYRCPSQKVKWLRDHGFLSTYSNEYQINSHKELNAGSGAILIDDSDSNISKYRRAGGRAICFPQPWNLNQSHVDHRLEFTKLRLEDLLGL